MVALLLVLLIFSFWAALGCGLLSALHTQRNLLQNTLLSPVTGLAGTTLVVVWINCLGVPLRYGGPVATIILIVLTGGLLRHHRPILPWPRLLPFAVILLAGAVATGYPFLRFGFQWVAICNDDMANYCLGAKLFLNHAHLFWVPAAADIIGDRDASLLYWFFFVPSAIRCGVETLLAWAASCTGLSPHEAFMPLILAFHLVLLSASAALVLQNRRCRKAALLTCLCLGLSALTTLGTAYQLLGQVCGLGVLAGLCSVLLRPAGRSRLRGLILVGLLMAALAVVYPEIVPFAGVSYLLYHAVVLAKRRESLRDVTVGLWPAAVIAGVFLNVLLVPAVRTLTSQSSHSLQTKTAAGVLLPYYLTPAGFAHLWGFVAIGERIHGVGSDAAIVAGAALFAFVIGAAMWQAWRGQPVAFTFLAISGLMVDLFWLRADFGLFKSAMYIQPFLLGTLLLSWEQVFGRLRTSVRSQAVWTLGLVVVVVCGVRVQSYYMRQSLGDAVGGAAEIPGASSTGLVGQLHRLGDGQRSAFVSDTANVVLAKFESLYCGPVYFYSQDFLGHFARVVSPSWNPFYRGSWKVFADKVIAQRETRIVSRVFDMHGAAPGGNEFAIRAEIAGNHTFSILASGGAMGIVNRRLSHESTGGPVVSLLSQGAIKNHLVFISSRLGQPYYLLGDDAGLLRFGGYVSMYNPERDPLFKNSTMAGLGRDSVFRIVNPSRGLRMVLEYTATLKGDRDNSIPAASVIGDRRVWFGCEGRGSARLFSEPLSPQDIDGGQYVGLDMGTQGGLFPQARSAVMNLYGRDILVDNRRIVGFARDISAISEEVYSALQPPSALQWFPEDLRNRDLEYCGIYEDGWVGEASYVVLEQREKQSALVVSVLVPRLSGRLLGGRLRVLVDKREVGQGVLAGGVVSFRLPVSGSGRRRVEVRFDRWANLPAPDGRPVSAQIKYIGFEPASGKLMGEGASHR